MTNKRTNMSVLKLSFAVLITLVMSLFLSTTTKAAEGTALAGETLSAFNPLAGLRGAGDPIVEDNFKRFADFDLYDEPTRMAIADELGVQNIVPVPRKYAIQQGKSLDGSTTTDYKSSQWMIKGEYGFVPTFSPQTEITVYKKNGTGYDVTPIYKINTTSGKTEKVDTSTIVTFSKNEEGYVKFTNLGYYKGEPVTIVMSPRNIENQVSIGLTEPSASAGSNPQSMMSISHSGINNAPASIYNSHKHLYNEYGSGYVDMDYSFYHSNETTKWKDDLADNSSNKIAVRGFYTYADFDFEESIGISTDIDIHSIYVLQADEKEDTEKIKLLDDPFNADKFEENFKVSGTVYEDDPLGIKVIQADSSAVLKGMNNKNPLQQYLYQYANEDSDWTNQLGFVKDGDFRYFNRGRRTDTEEYKISNWLSFTYEETETFTLRVNVSALDHFDPNAMDSRKKANANNKANDNKIEELDTSPANEAPGQKQGNGKFFIGRNLMLYKIMDKQLEKSGKTDISDILEFKPYSPEGNYVFNEITDKDKVIIGYKGTAAKPDIAWHSIGFTNTNKDISQLKEYYETNYAKYKKQQVKNSTEENILDLLYEMLTKVDSAKGKYSAYGYNKDNIGNFYSQSSVTHAKNAGYNIPNEGVALLSLTEDTDVRDSSGNGFPTLVDFLRYVKQPGGAASKLNIFASTYRQSYVDAFGSNVFFTSDTILPIGFPAPVKEVDSDDEKLINDGKTANNKIVWSVQQTVPPRVIENSEPTYIFKDTIDKSLKIESVKVIDKKTQIDETADWNLSTTNNEIVLTPKDLKLKSFYNRTFEIKITTSANEAELSKMDKTELEKNYVIKDGYLEVKNIGSVTMAPRTGQSKDHVLYTRPDYDIDHETQTPTIGKLKLMGDLEITKIAADDGKLLDGAEFELRETKDATTAVKKGTTNNGKLSFDKIPIGTYWLVETKAPTGYKAIEPFELTIFPFKTAANSFTIEDEYGRLIGEFSSVTKSVRDENDQDIDKKVVAFDQVIEYTIKPSLKEESDKTELNQVSVKDTLDKGLTKVDGTTKVVFKKKDGTEEEILLDDAKVWSKSATDKVDVLDSSSYTQFSLTDGTEMLIKFNVKVNHQAGKEIVNKATAKATGNKASGGVESVEKESNKVTNYLGKDVYLRQVVLNKNDALAVPKNQTADNNVGFVRMNNVDGGTNDLLSSLSLSIPSDEDSKLPEFKDVFVSPSQLSSVYQVKVVVPEMYQYAGFIVSKDKTLDMTQLNTGEAKLDISATDTQYLTVFIEPKEKKVDPVFYNWDYKFNVFNQSLSVK